ncbi:Uncharacterized protein BP5553_05479 [Venustampulla echinocandica]|uniref:DUF7598 domain-containing protein n=1 Tax=Venustampulla echinocandica TaxID=2656787 RepID=A0A370TR91_9HELO|nr:Uncharacterized protein BP5553_05479 [Venustampulla echinocandica]RDL38046.1 Uncharacterized protein BP5553_05479 [Venustampulla echinocandica]
MFKMSSESKMAGPGYIILNIIRAMNIISLLLVAIASWVMLVMTLKTSSFFFFDGVSHFITSVIACFLIISELSLFQSYFVKNWPNFGPEHGFVCLGLSMIVLGFNILGNLNKAATSVENLGLPLWRVVISAGILASLSGLFNIIATYVFSQPKLGISGRQVRGQGAATFPSSSTKSNYSVSSGSIRKAESPVLPTYHTPTEERRKSRFGLKFPIRTSGISKPIPTNQEQFSKWDDRSSPVVPDVQRPPTAMHPALHPPAPAYPASSRYSVVSNMTRF